MATTFSEVRFWG